MDLSGITIDDGDDGPSHSLATLEADGVVILAQPAANPQTLAFVDVEDQQADGNPADDFAP